MTNEDLRSLWVKLQLHSILWNKEKHWYEHTVCAFCLTELRPLDTHRTVSYFMCLISPTDSNCPHNRKSDHKSCAVSVYLMVGRLGEKTWCIDSVQRWRQCLCPSGRFSSFRGSGEKTVRLPIVKITRRWPNMVIRRLPLRLNAPLPLSRVTSAKLSAVIWSVFPAASWAFRPPAVCSALSVQKAVTSEFLPTSMAADIFRS